MFACARSRGAGLGGLAAAALAVALYLGGVGVMWKAWADGGKGARGEQCAVACAKALPTQAGG